MDAMSANFVAVLTFIAVSALLLLPRLRKLDAWRATVTPLASIIGSGFLVSLPLLASVVGSWAIFAMLGLCGLAYLLGAAIRFNIFHGEWLAAQGGDHRIAGSVERLSHLFLAFAYFISVTYYLTLLGAFLLKGFGIIDPLVAKAITSTLLFAIGGYGVWRGLHGLESVEEYAVSLNLAVIAAVLISLLFLNLLLLTSGAWRIEAPTPELKLRSAAVVLGMLIVVQGFETSRFLRGVYPPALRIKTMRAAQLISTVVYAAFFALATVLLGGHVKSGDVAAVTTMFAVVAPVLPLMLVGGAVFAQASAAIADSIAAAGLIADITAGRVQRNFAYPVVALVGIAITWAANVYEVIALASRAFAFFYLMQCLVAAAVAQAAPAVSLRHWRIAGFLALALIALLVVLFGVSAESG